MGNKAREIDEFKLSYLGGSRAKNGMGILVDKKLSDQVVEVSCKSDSIMSIKLVSGAEV